MQNTTLRLESGIITFCGISKQTEYFDCRIFVDGPSYISIRSETAYRIYKEDVDRLLLYFDQHIKNVASDEYQESLTFVTKELCFQLRALDGVIETRMDGYFTVNFMLNCKPDGYWGVEGILDLVDLNEFLEGLKLMVYNAPTS